MAKTDDRGVPCRVAEVLPEGAVHPGIGGGSGRPVLYYVAIGLVAGVVGAVWIIEIDSLIASVSGGFRTGMWGAAGAASAVAIASDIWLRRRIARRRWDTVARLHLASGSCPSCAYALRGLPPDAEGFVQCPECSAAWRSDRLGDNGAAPTD